jgi:hypothetical protein
LSTKSNRGHGLDIANLDVGGVHQCVDTLNARDEFETSADIEGGARGGRHPHPVDALNLACRDGIGVHVQHRRWPTVGVDQLGRQSRLDPLRAQYRSGRQAGDDAEPRRPQPRRLCPLSCG